MSDKIETLNIDDPKDARRFLLEVMNTAFPDGRTITYVVLESGRKLRLDEMSDSECLQYARELLPIFEAAFPGHVDMQHEH